MLNWLELFLAAFILPFLAGFGVGLLFVGVEATWNGVARWFKQITGQ